MIIGMLRRGAITPLDAYKRGCMRLASRIHELRERGWVINTALIDVGNHTQVAQYTLIKEPEQ